MRAKVLLLLAVCMAVVVGAEIPGSTAQDQRARAGGQAERTTVAELGVSVSHPRSWRVERERYTYDETRGFTLWKTGGEDTEDHGGTPAARVALAPEIEPRQIEEAVRQRIAEQPDLDLTRTEVRLGERGLKGVAVGTIPGSTPSTEVYVAVEDRVYLINVYGVGLDAEGKRLLKSLRFDDPTRSESSLVQEVPDAGNPRTFYKTDQKVRDLTRRDQASRQKSASAEETTRSTATTRATTATNPEKRIAEGCYIAPSTLWVQTQHGPTANRLADDPGTNAPTGFSIIGTPNFWG